MKHRVSVDKSRSAGKFRRNVSRSRAVNFKGSPMRGGIRM